MDLYFLGCRRRRYYRRRHQWRIFRRGMISQILYKQTSVASTTNNTSTWRHPRARQGPLLFTTSVRTGSALEVCSIYICGAPHWDFSMSHHNWLYYKLAMWPDENLTKTSGYIMRVCDSVIKIKTWGVSNLLLYGLCCVVTSRFSLKPYREHVLLTATDSGSYGTGTWGHIVGDLKLYCRYDKNITQKNNLKLNIWYIICTFYFSYFYV